MGLDKDYIKKVFDTLTAEEQGLVTLLSVICSEGLSLDVACNILMSDRPRDFNSHIDKLNAQNWIFCDCQSIYIEQSIAELVLKISPIDNDVAIRLLTSLSKYIVLQPLDDMRLRQQYFVVARLCLTYLMNHWQVYANNSQLASLFSDAVIAFATNVELSFYGNKRQFIHNLEHRIDFQLLAFLKGLELPHSEGYIDLLLGRLYTSIFRYNEARTCFEKAHAILGNDAELLLAEAVMYENLSLNAKAFQFAYRAYLINKEKRNYDANIKVSLYIAYLCAVNESPQNCKHWRKRARSLMDNRTVPAGHIFNITMNEIEALIHLDDTALAHQIMDSVELEVYRLYGYNAPEMSRVHYIRSLVDGEIGQLRKSNEYYSRYVYTNHLNYGYSVGDTAALYSAIIHENIIRGNGTTANIFAIKMQDLYAEGSNIAPGVRFSQAVANCVSNLVDERYDLSKDYHVVAKKVYDELQPDVDTLSEIAPIFQDGVLPQSVLMTEEARTLNLISFNICLGEGKVDDAKRLIELQLEVERDENERKKWKIKLGQALIVEGKIDDAVQLWWGLLDKIATRNRFEICKEIADTAMKYGLNYEAKMFLEEALMFNVMVYAKTSEIAEALQCYAHILNYCGFDGSNETWEQAMLFMKSMENTDGLALLFLFWGIAQQDGDAESLIKKAISYWRPEPGIFDETLSSMFHHLSCVQTMQGKHDEALSSAQEAIRLYPTEYPPYLMEEMEENFPL